MKSIGEASRLSGITIETIRYYEREGIIPRTSRTESGRRVFEVQAIAQLKFIRRCRDLGFSLADIKALSSLRLNEEAICSEAQAIGECHLEQVRTKIRDLEALETALAQLLTHCREGRPNCAMLDKLFED